MSPDQHRPPPQPPPRSVAVVILNYNTSAAVATLYHQIASLRQGRPALMEYVVVDNASRPEEVARLQEFCAGRPDIHLTLNATNDGYACGNNVGLRKAAELGFEYCLIANSDIAFLTPDFLELLLEAARTLPDCGLIGPRVVLPNGSPQGPLPETGVLNGVIPLSVPRCERTEPVYATVGCCFFGSTRIFERIGWLDEATFLYREEIILAERLRQHGLLWYYLPAVVVRHDHVRKVDSIRKIILHKKFEARSTVYYFRRYRNRSALAILAYRGLLAAKVAAAIAISLASRTIRHLRRRST